MFASALQHDRSAPSAPASLVGRIGTQSYEVDGPRVAIPRPEIQLVVRSGPTTNGGKGGIDVHVFGARRHVHRKLIRGGQWAVTARLRLGVSTALLGVSASVMAGRLVALEELWGDAAAQRLRERLTGARDAEGAAALLKNALSDRCTSHTMDAHTRLALAAVERLGSANVNAVAAELGVSERQLRRVFRETLGLSPKELAKLQRFHRALRLARANTAGNWAQIAVAAGYYDQAHLIADFQAIANTTPRGLLRELRAEPVTPRP